MAAKSGPGGGAHSNNTSAKELEPEKGKVQKAIEKFNGNDNVMNTDETMKSASAGDSTETMEHDGTEKLLTETSGGQSSSGASAPPALSYSNAVERTSTNAPYKIEIFFRKNSTESSTSLTNEQKGKLIFKKLNVPAGKLLGLDDSQRDRIVLLIAGDVQGYQLNLAQSVQAKPGLYTKPVAPVVKPVHVKIYGTSLDTPMEQVEDMMKNFGIMTSKMEHQKYEIPQSEGEDAMMMDGVTKGDMQVWMKIRKNIPSVLLIAGRRCIIKYVGQAKHCTRCLKRYHVCPGKGWPAKCQEIFEDQTNCQGLPRGNIGEIMNEIHRSSIPDDSDTSTNAGIEADYVDLENIPEAMNAEQLCAFLNQNNLTLQREQLEQDEKRKTKWRVRGLLPLEVTAMKTYIHGRKLGGEKGRKVEVFPMLASTPPSNNIVARFSPDSDSTARRTLQLDQGQGKEVSPQSAAQGLDNTDKKTNDNDTNVNSNSSSKQTDSSVMEVSRSREVVEVDEDGKTVPRPPASGQVISVSLMKEQNGEYSVKQKEGGDFVSPKKKPKRSLAELTKRAVANVGKLADDLTKAKAEANKHKTKENQGKVKNLEKLFQEASTKANNLQEKLKVEEAKAKALQEMTEEEKKKVLEEKERVLRAESSKRKAEGTASPSKEELPSDSDGEVQEIPRSPLQSSSKRETERESRQTRSRKKAKGNTTLGVHAEDQTKKPSNLNNSQ